ncbi:MAG: hypothetical protein AAF696_19130 [Bacteroidota bacterium]
MNKNHLFTFLLIGISSLLVIQLIHSRVEIQQMKEELKAVQIQKDRSNDHSEALLLDAMERFQRFGTKLWYAGNNENWELASFYTHEIEEVIEELQASDIEEEGHKVADLVSRMPLPALEKVEESIHNKNYSHFQSSYKMLVTACNACHAATQKPFIQIQVPDHEANGNQSFRIADAD